MTRRRDRRAAVAFLVVAALATSCADDEPARADRAAATTTAPAETPTTTAATTTTGLASPCPAPTATLTNGRFTIDVGGEPREYLLHLPDGLEPSRPVPVILNFHGSGSDMDQQAAYSQLPERGGARGYVVLTPQGTGSPRGWALRGGGTDDAFVEALLTHVATGVCLAPGRAYVAGISNGSAFSALYACRHPDRIAAVGMVAATLPSLCPVEVPMPAVAFHGTDDAIVPYDGGGVRGANDGTQAPGAEGAMAQWAQRNGCAEPPNETTIGSDVTERAWSGCAGGADVRFYKIAGGGHTWPGGIDLSAAMPHLGAVTASVSATDVFLDFFDAHPA